jgi:hypothetical protein
MRKSPPPFTDEHKQRIREAHKKNGLRPPSALGLKRSQETKDKLSAIFKGRKMSVETRVKMSLSRKGKIPWNKGLKGVQKGYWTNKKRLSFTGKNNPNWKGGITPVHQQIRQSLEYKLWRRAVFERDNYICIWCGNRGGKLNADHIKPFAYYPELRFAIDNGRTLCKSCHKTTDTYSGKGFKRK